MEKLMSEPTVELRPSQLVQAVQKGIVTAEQSATLWAFLSDPGRSTVVRDGQVVGAPRFDFTHVLYYFGGMLAIGAMSLFMTLSWQAFGRWGVFGLALAYFVGCWLAAQNLLKRGLRVPAGILATIGIVLIPLMVWCLQHAFGMWPDGGVGNDRYSDYHKYIDWRWITLELATLAAAAVMLWKFRLPFMVMPVAVTLWYMSMDVAYFLMRDGDPWGSGSWEFRRNISLVFGLITCLIAAWVDMRCRQSRRINPQALTSQDFAFWLYIFGAIMAWGGLSAQNSGSQWGKVIYCLINVGMIFLGAVIARRVFTILGALGVVGYLGYLSHQVFQNSLGFAVMLTLLGLSLVAVGVWWQRNEANIALKLAKFRPAWLKDS
jgi:hypothetical protein